MSIVRFDPPLRGPPGALEEANHRIANHLAIAAGMVSAQISTLRQGPPMLTRQAAEQMLRDTANRIHGIARLHRRLMREPGTGLIEISDLLLETIRQFASALSLDDRLSVCHSLASGCVLHARKAHTLTLIVGEIVLNAAKHAHPTGVPIEISVACTSSGNGTITVEICDDGIGLPEGFDTTKDGGFGFGLIRNLAQSIGARLQIESDDLGLCFRMVFDADNRDAETWMKPRDRTCEGLSITP